MKHFQNLGRSLTKNEQKKIGGGRAVCITCPIQETTLCAGSNSWECKDTGYQAIQCANFATGEIKNYACTDPL